MGHVGDAESLEPVFSAIHHIDGVASGGVIKEGCGRAVPAGWIAFAHGTYQLHGVGLRKFGERLFMGARAAALSAASAGR